MGFFSWNGLSTSIAWQNDAVLLLSNGTRVIGEYDGYGGIGDFDISDSGVEPELWHDRCWDKADKPDYSGPSIHADDQGYFYDNSEDEEQLDE